MAKKSKDQELSPKKLVQDKIVNHLLQEFKQLETLVGKKEFSRRLKKSAKMITEGLKFEDATMEERRAQRHPEKEQLQNAKPASEKTGRQKRAPKKPVGAAAPKKAMAKKNKPK